MVLTSVPDQMH